MRDALDAWISRQAGIAGEALRRSLSPIGLVKFRPGFGQTLRAARGAVIASPVLASWDPEPDYYFHWFRDAALVMDARRLLDDDQSLSDLADFVRFTVALATLDGGALAGDPVWRERVAPEFVQYLRSDEELHALHGEAVWADTRVNPDGTLDITRWSRPQHDGPALTVLCLLRWLPHVPGGSALNEELRALLLRLLDFTALHGRQPAHDIWEEDLGQHYYTLRVAAAALAGGADLIAPGDEAAAAPYRREAVEMLRLLDAHWLPRERHYSSRQPVAGAVGRKALDISVILAAVHTHDGARGAHTVHDARQQATLDALDAAFAAAYPINQGRPDTHGTAMGRYVGDVYFSGGPWYLATLGAAEFCYRAALGSVDAAHWIARGEAYLQTVRTYTPDDGALSEQFDPRSGAPTSARHLAWSYAAFLSCVAARRDALGKPRSPVPGQ